MQVAAVLYGYKNAMAHFICGPLEDCSLEVYTTGKTLPGGDIDLPHGLLNAIASEALPILLKFSNNIRHCILSSNTLNWNQINKFFHFVL